MATVNKDLGPVTAYAYAKEGGYTGTATQFETDLADSANLINTIDEMISGKADKVSSATNNNFAALDANGNLKDSGHKHSDYLTSHQDISGKADKVTSATNGNLASLDANGNLTDSGIPSVTTITSTDPYTYRKSLGNLADIEIEGASVAWNQLAVELSTSYWEVFNSSYCSMTSSDRVVTVTINTQVSSNYQQGIRVKSSYRKGLVANHKYLVRYSVKPSVSCTFMDEMIASSRGHDINCVANQWNTNVFVDQPPANTGGQYLIYPKEKLSANSTYQVKDFNVIDLTLLFGSTIADAIYAMEQATAGAGVAFFRKYFGKDYYAYDAGSIQSVCVGSRKVIGFNQWDEEWELGEIDTTTGQNTSASDRIRSKNYIPCIPSTDYYFRGSTDLTGNVYYYDVNKNYLGTGTGTAFNIIRTIPNNVRYVRFRLAKVYGTTYKNDICINISDTAKNGTYEPYTSTAYPFDSTKQLRGLVSLEGGELKANGDIYTADGNIQRKYGIVNLGTLTWAYNSTSQFFWSQRNDLKISPRPNIVAQMYTYVGRGSTGTLLNAQNLTLYYYDDPTQFRIKNTAYTDADTFKTAMSGVYLVYELATPTTESAQPYQNPQRAYIDGTGEFTDGLTRDVMIPVGNNTTYQQDKILPSVEDYVDAVADNKVDKVSNVTNGHLAGLDANGNLTDSGIDPTSLGGTPTLDINPSSATISGYPNGAMWLVTS